MHYTAVGMTDTGTLHPVCGAESKTRWILTGPTYRHRFKLASLGWIPRAGLWYFDGKDVSDHALKFARSLRGTRIAKRYIVQRQGKLI